MEEVKKEEIYTKRTQLDSKELRDKIEEKLPPFDVEELMMKGKLSQEIPLGKDLSIKLVTIPSGGELLIDKLVNKICVDSSLPYGKLIMIAQLAASLEEYNKVPLIKTLVEYSPDRAEEYEKYIIEKMEAIYKFNTHMTQLLITHLFWFDDRVNKYIKEKFLEDATNF